MSTPPDVLAGSATGSIYDLGYRRYDGPRLGRRHAIEALFVHGVRAVFGLGRSGRAKIAPLVLGGLIALPAVVSVGFGALAGNAAREGFNPITLEGYLPFAQTLLVFFVAAQAPELLVRDQRHRVLTLYFSRALERTDYVLAKYLALLAAVGIVLALPQAILLLGMLFATPDVGAGLGEVLPRLWPVVGRTVLVNRVGLEWPFTLMALADPFALMDGVSAFLFGFEPTMPAIVRSDLPLWLFAAVAVAVSLAALVLLLLRYRRIAA